MNRYRRLLTGLAALAVAAGALSACSSAGATAKDYQFTTSTTYGSLIPAADRKPAEDIGGRKLQGGTYHLTQDAGHVRVVNFFGSWCGPCRVETPQFALLSDELVGKGVDFVGIDIKDDHSEAVTFVDQSKVHYPVVFDDTGRNQLLLGNIPGNLPYTVLIDKSGKVAAVYEGRPATAGDLIKPINALLAER